MKVILEIEYHAAECTIISVIKVLRKSGMVTSVYKIERFYHQPPMLDRKEVYFSIAFIKKVVCMVTEMPEEMLDSSSRQQEIVENRQIAMYLCRTYTRKSLREIGVEFGNKTPATIMHACKVIRNLVQTDKKFKEKLEKIESFLIG